MSEEDSPAIINPDQRFKASVENDLETSPIFSWCSHQMVKFVLSNLESTIYSRNKLVTQVKKLQAEYFNDNDDTNNNNNVLSSTVLKFDRIHFAMEIILKSKFGLTLHRMGNTKKGGSNSSSSYILLKLNCSSFLLTDILLNRSIKEYRANITSTYSDTGDRSGNDSFTRMSGNNTDLVLNGILSCVLVIIIMKKNSILHEELLTQLEKFGISSEKKQTQLYGYIDFEIEEFLKNLIKLDYIERIDAGSNKENKGGSGYNSGDTNIQYRIGRRTFYEFSQEHFIIFLKRILRLSDDDGDIVKQLSDNIELIVGDTYADGGDDNGSGGLDGSVL
ncbi:Smc5-Smc6 complex subunit NSE3 SCDLUD_004593 [Saccharomycodes ludwigii]|uniref:Smc5-Smc6 complex subunit NSE3 n=1 Tax=Saccharomycodes ludwigii TaxID=36035 RepID=UPI001E87DF56|nr:hypothetical protein SCDLUD_004593 [Saccharomycodes ludwigii]KAH3899164.1 hypothetical protein SCDLUD_004593 [Saccharomycodes ludwigii]